MTELWGFLRISCVLNLPDDVEKRVVLHFPPFSLRLLEPYLRSRVSRAPCAMLRTFGLRALNQVRNLVHTREWVHIFHSSHTCMHTMIIRSTRA